MLFLLKATVGGERIVHIDGVADSSPTVTTTPGIHRKRLPGFLRTPQGFAVYKKVRTLEGKAFTSITGL